MKLQVRTAVLLSSVLLALGAALAGALTAQPPRDGPPGYALDSLLIWRCEIAAVVFGLLYAAIVVIWLSCHGLTPTRVGSSGVEIPQAADARGDGIARRDRPTRPLRSQLHDLTSAVDPPDPAT